MELINGVSHVGGLLGAAASRLRGAGSACGKGLGGALEKGLWAYNAAQRVSTIQEKMQSGDIVGATLDTLEAAVGVRRMLQACFVAGTPLLTPEGSKRIEEFAVGDWVLSRNESGRPIRGLVWFVPVPGPEGTGLTPNGPLGLKPRNKHDSNYVSHAKCSSKH